MALTTKQRDILAYIEEISEKKGVPPTFREIREYFGFSSLGTVYSHIRTLKKKKVLKEGKYSQIELVNEETVAPFAKLSIIGEIIEQQPPIIWTQSIPYILPQTFVIDEKTAYLFLARGSSLHAELIDHEDLLLVQSGVAAVDGDLVFALKQGAVFIRTYFKEGSYVRLESKTNSSPIFVDQEDLLIQGIITAIIRPLIPSVKPHYNKLI